MICEQNKIGSMYRPLWIEIDLGALRYNFMKIKKIVGHRVKIMATLKQQAYGHGLIPLARELSHLGVDFFGLGSLEEAIILRRGGFKEDILVLSVVDKRFVSEFVKYRVIPTVVDLPFARSLNREAKRRRKKIPIHVKIDTGMGRLGVWYNDSFDFIKSVVRFPNLELEGIYTHFPVADVDVRFTRNQIKTFNAVVECLEEEGIKFKYHHCANSIGLIRYKEAHFNIVRPGLILYGIKPSHLDMKFKPVLSLKSKVIFVKKVGKGRSISYGRTFIASSSRFIATVACGYADGYPWSLSNRSKVIIRNKLFNVVGRVCMDHIMVDLRNCHVRVGEEVILIGKSQSKSITVEDLASLCGTIPYEIVSRLSLKIPRIYKNSLANGR